MQKCIVFLLVCSFVFQSTMVFAQTPKELDVLQTRIEALQDYVARMSVQWNPSTQKPVPHEIVRSSIINGTSWLVAAQEENGHFAYEYLPYEDEYRHDDNIVRQAGALYALGEVIRKSSVESKETADAIENAISYFEMLSPSHEYEGKQIRCITKSQSSSICKLGATSLALIGILGYVEHNPEKGNEYNELIEEYVAYIVASKKPDTGFKDEYSTGSGFIGDQESSFSNGEALLALVRYYNYKPNDEVKQVVDESFAYLTDTPFDTPLYLWMMAALKDMQVLWPNDMYLTYGKEFTFWRLNLMKAFHSSSHNYCPANEGFASAYSLLEQDLSLVEKTQLRTEIDFWNTKNVGLQIDSKEKLRAVLENGQLVFKEILNLEQSKGGFLTSDAVPTQRIDFTQHCLNAYLQTLVDIDKQKL